MKYFSKYINKIWKPALILCVLWACQEEDQEFGPITAPSNVNITAEIVGVDALNPNGDGSGFVILTASADNALTYDFDFGDGQSEVVGSGQVTHRFSVVGLNNYNVVVNAVGTGGLKTSAGITVSVFSSFDDQEAKDFLSGGPGNSKIWYLAASEPGHLGVGGTAEISADAYWWPSFFSAVPFEKCNDAISDCLCDDELTFTQSATNQLSYQLNNNGQTFFNAGHQVVIGENAGEDACFDFDTSGISAVSISPSNNDWSAVPDPDFMARGTVLNFSDDAFMGYYVSSSTYEILTITNDALYVRTIDGLNPVLAWYHKFSTTNPSDLTACDANTGDTASGNNDILVWAEEFDIDGAPCTDNWTYDIGTGSNGWGNNEAQYYTNDPSNIIVENGLLKITAKAESFAGSDYTSSRIKSQDLFEFQYGRVEVRAKLPEGGGTWPAIWMLGADFDLVGWPDAGEIDIMEHIGNNQNTIHGTLHYPGNSGANGVGNSTVISNASSEFHIYEMVWTASSINFYVNGNQFHSFANTTTVPFNHDFFLILNVAMGGNFGGAIDPSFLASTMEIDYIRVYQ